MNMKTTGFTLIELIITLAVLSVLMAVGIPQFTGSTANSRLTAAINSLSGDLSFARTEAIKRGIDVKVTSANNADWALGGWTVAEDGGADLRISPALSGGATIASNVSTVTFSPNGRSTAAATFTLCDDRSGNFGKRVTLNTSGQTFLVTQISCNP